jgi:hypothetical protein
MLFSLLGSVPYDPTIKITHPYATHHCLLNQNSTMIYKVTVFRLKSHRDCIVIKRKGFAR